MLKQVLEIIELLDNPRANGNMVAELLKQRGLERVEVKEIREGHSKTDFIRIVIPGHKGK